MKLLTITLLLLLHVAAFAGTNDIVLRSSFTKIQQPGKTTVFVDVPVILTPAEDFDVNFDDTNQVVIKPKWNYVPSTTTFVLYTNEYPLTFTRTNDWPEHRKTTRFSVQEKLTQSSIPSSDLYRAIREWTEAVEGKRSSFTLYGKEYQVTNHFGAFFEVVAYNDGDIRLCLPFTEFLTHRAIAEIETYDLKKEVDRLKSQILDLTFVCKSNVVVTNSWTTVDYVQGPTPHTNGYAFKHPPGWRYGDGEIAGTPTNGAVVSLTNGVLTWVRMEPDPKTTRLSTSRVFIISIIGVLAVMGMFYVAIETTKLAIWIKNRRTTNS